MLQSEINTKWNIQDSVLGFHSVDGFKIPSTDNIYAAVFENKYSNEINEGDVKSLKNKLSFSKYPVELKIVLRSVEKVSFSIELIIQAVLENGDFKTVSFLNKADHIVIENTWYPFPTGLLEELMKTLKSVGIIEPGRIRLGQYLLLLKLGNDAIKNDVQFLNSNRNVDNLNEKPLGLMADLYPYQKKGWEWLRFMRQEKIGGILADEMGLGKTIQIISLFCSDKEDVFPALIISPATLLENWRREFAKFAPHINTYIHQGPKRTGFPNEIRKYDVVITSYETIIRDSSLISQIEWKVVVCDEAQAIKNPQTKRAISVKKIPRQIGFAVTGTPIENSLTDLWSIIDFSAPGFLSNQAVFEKRFNHIDGASELEKIISPLILRRRVIEVAKDLPAKIIIPQVLELNSEEVSLYEQIRIETINEFKSNASLVVLSRLRMFCAHPFLIEDKPNEDATSYSNKFKRLIEIVEEIVANGAKILVFTSFTKMIDIIVSNIQNRFGIYSNSIDGRTAINDRQKIVDEFSAVEGSALLALNPIAAGTGLNITAANHVIHYNLEWNPAKEDQASARAYRRGQDRPVIIHRLFYTNTVEEAIDERLDRKRLLAGEAIVGVQGLEDDYNDILTAIHKSPKEND